ncbi:MAG: TetR/AcrR family transcriptional regulator [Desulfuromonadales bacterium]|nr:TetR/AcrR family transcriptional regulator [Desulfuromonadales bacterium]
MGQKKIDKREAIMQAAMELIADQGFHGTPTSQIAEKAGTGVGTIYRYFKDKDELIEAIHEKVHTAFVRTFSDNYDAGLPIRENYLRIFTALTKLFVTNQFEIRFIEQYYNSPYGVAKKRAEEIECEKPMFAFFEQGKQQQVIKDMPFEFILSLSLGSILILVRDHHNGFIALDEQAIATVVEANWDAIKR